MLLQRRIEDLFLDALVDGQIIDQTLKELSAPLDGALTGALDLLDDFLRLPARLREAGRSDRGLVAQVRCQFALAYPAGERAVRCATLQCNGAAW